MRVLVTAGSTEVDVDLVRHLRTVDHDLVLSNGFRGETGERIARHLWANGHKVTLVTSSDRPARWEVINFRTYNDLAGIMEREITSGCYDIVIHSAAVSDFYVAGVFAYVDGVLTAVDTSAKISSSYDRIFLDLRPTEKLIDKIREPWGFKGKLVKFKLQVGITEQELIGIARKSKADSKADIIVANLRETYKERAYIIGQNPSLCHSISRDLLYGALYKELGL